jgi:hypothetical protein
VSSKVLCNLARNHLNQNRLYKVALSKTVFELRDKLLSERNSGTNLESSSSPSTYTRTHPAATSPSRARPITATPLNPRDLTATFLTQPAEPELTRTADALASTSGRRSARPQTARPGVSHEGVTRSSLASSPSRPPRPASATIRSSLRGSREAQRALPPADNVRSSVVDVAVPGECHRPAVKAAIEAAARDAWRQELLADEYPVEGESPWRDSHYAPQTQRHCPGQTWTFDTCIKAVGKVEARGRNPPFAVRYGSFACSQTRHFRSVFINDSGSLSGVPSIIKPMLVSAGNDS